MSTPRPSEADVEALAKVLHGVRCSYTGPILYCSGPCHYEARAVLASDWLAARDAEHEREVAGPTWDAVTLRGIAAHAVDRAEAAERALADLRCEIKALADEWAVLEDYVDDPGSTPEQWARARAGVVAAEQLRALLPRDDAAGAGGAE